MVMPAMVTSVVGGVSRLVVHVMVLGRVAETQLTLHARAADRTQHRRRHRTPDGEQDSQQQQEPDSDGLHGSVQ